MLQVLCCVRAVGLDKRYCTGAGKPMLYVFNTKELKVFFGAGD
jgi:hypothetical protein